jgi:hypothetical protein
LSQQIEPGHHPHRIPWELYGTGRTLVVDLDHDQTYTPRPDNHEDDTVYTYQNHPPELPQARSRALELHIRSILEPQLAHADSHLFVLNPAWSTRRTLYLS